MRRLVLPVLATLCLTAWAAAYFILRSQSGNSDIVLPTSMVLPSLTPTDTASPTLTPIPGYPTLIPPRPRHRRR